MGKTFGIAEFLRIYYYQGTFLQFSGFTDFQLISEVSHVCLVLRKSATSEKQEQNQ